MEEKKFMSTKDIANYVGVSESVAQKHKNEMYTLYDIDMSRLPKRGYIHTEIVKEYFRKPKRKKDV